MIDLEPVIKLLYKLLMEHNKPTTPLGDNCAMNNTKTNRDVSILEVSDFANEYEIIKYFVNVVNNLTYNY